jgi:hypothetical protein
MAAATASKVRPGDHHMMAAGARTQAESQWARLPLAPLRRARGAPGPARRGPQCSGGPSLPTREGAWAFNGPTWYSLTATVTVTLVPPRICIFRAVG